MEIQCSAFNAHDEIKLIVEPWGDELPVPKGSFLRLMLDGEPGEEMVVNWLDRAVMVWPPRFAVLRVLSASGQTLMEFDTREIPATPSKKA